MAAARERLLVAKKLEGNGFKVKELMERFNSLMEQKHYRLAEGGRGSRLRSSSPAIRSQFGDFGSSHGGLL